jgi:hypothetical protein
MSEAWRGFWGMISLLDQQIPDDDLLCLTTT